MLPVKYEVCRKIFAQFNIGFFQLKKDQCSTCTKYQQLNAEEKKTFQHEFDDHLKRKDLALLGVIEIQINLLTKTIQKFCLSISICKQFY